MDSIAFWDKVGISVKSRKILQKILHENPVLESIIYNSKSVVEVHAAIREWLKPILKQNPVAEKYYRSKTQHPGLAEKLSWQDYAIIRILDYIDHSGDEFPDQNIGGKLAQTNPFKILWLAAHKGTGGAKVAFFNDMLQLFRQLNGTQNIVHPTTTQVQDWMRRYPSGLDPKVENLRKENKKRIIRILIEKIDSGEISSKKYFFEAGISLKKEGKTNEPVVERK